MCILSISVVFYHYLRKPFHQFSFGLSFSKGRNCDKLSNSTKLKLLHCSLFNRRHNSSIKCSHCVFHVKKETSVSETCCSYFPFLLVSAAIKGERELNIYLLVRLDKILQKEKLYATLTTLTILATYKEKKKIDFCLAALFFYSVGNTVFCWFFGLFLFVFSWTFPSRKTKGLFQNLVIVFLEKLKFSNRLPILYLKCATVSYVWRY